jgi:hypothetical protein
LYVSSACAVPAKNSSFVSTCSYVYPEPVLTNLRFSA